jgi:4'-phosphopantetheinyl transferase
MILTLYEPEKIKPKDIKDIYRLMPLDRKAKFDSYHFDKDKILCAAAYILLLYGICLTDKCLYSTLQFTYGKHGKPSLIDHPNIQFNLSHCSCGVVCALSHEPVGIDIQTIDEYNAILIPTVMSTEEQQLIACHHSPDVVFTRLWTCKESYLKYTGSGINCSLKKLSFPQASNHMFYEYGCCFTISEYSGMVITLCEKTRAKHAIINLNDNMISDFLIRFP